jgi:hypothetical protein
VRTTDYRTTFPEAKCATAQSAQERWLSDLTAALRKLYMNPGQRSAAFYRASVLRLITADCVEVGIGQAEIDAALSAGTLHALVARVPALRAKQEARRNLLNVTLTCAVLMVSIAVGLLLV